MPAVNVEEVRQRIIAEAHRQGVDPSLMLGIALAESSLNPQAIGDNGQAVGLFQLQKAAAQDVGLSPAERYDMQRNIEGGIAYFKNRLRREGGDINRAVSAYNQGVGTRQGQLSNPQYVQTVRQYQRREHPLLARLARTFSPREAAAAEVSPRDRGEELWQAVGLQAPAPQTPAPAPAQAPAPGGRPAAADRGEELWQAVGLQAPAPQTPAPAPAQAPHAPAQAPGGAPPAPSPADEVEVQSGPPGTLPRPGAAAPAAAPAPGPEVQEQLGREQEQQRLAAERGVGSRVRPAPTPAELARLAASTGMSWGSSALGAAAGTMVAPLLGPAAPAGPVLGEMAGSYLGRQANVALGLEKPGTVGDVLSVAVPGVTGLPRVIRGVRAGAVPAAVPRGREPLRQEAAAFDVPLTYGEAADQPMARRFETTLEQLPVVGTGGFRARQQQAVHRAAQAETTRRQEIMQQVPWQGVPAVQQAAQQGNRQAQRVLDDIDRSGEDWSRIVQASGNLRAFRTRQVANRLYGEVDQAAQGLGAVPPERTVQTLHTVLDELQGAVVPDQPTIALMEQIRDQLTTTPRTYRQMRQFDSDLGDMVEDYYQGRNAVVGAKGVGSFTRLRAALREDLDQFAAQSGVPEVRALHQRANRFYERQVIPYEDAQLARALRTDTPDEIYRAFIQRGHRDRAQQFYHALEPRGRAAVQYGMVAEALERGVHPTTGHFSPVRFAAELERIQDARGVFFRGQEAWRLDGLARVMRAAERAGAFTENPPTGQRVINALLGTGLIGLAPAAKVAATAAGMRWLLTSRAGSSLLLRAHRTGQDTLQMQELLRQLQVQGARQLGTEVGEGVQEGTQVEVEPGRVQR